MLLRGSDMTNFKFDRNASILFLSLLVEGTVLLVAVIMSFFRMEGYFAPAITSMFSMVGSLYYYLSAGQFSYIYVDSTVDDSINDEVLEDNVINIFRKMGYRLENIVNNGNTKDMIMHNKKDKIIINIYQHSDEVDVDAIQNLVISMWHYDAAKGYLITNKNLDKKVKNMVCSCNVELWDKETLIDNM